MAANSQDRRARIHDLDMNHQSNVHKIDLVNKDEEARRLKLRVLALRDDNASLKDAVAQKHARLVYLQRQTNDVRAELEESKQTSKTQEQRVQKQAKEISDLRAELESLNVSVQDSDKTLQEKFALARDLNRIKLEKKDLETQLANHQAVVAEKLDLQRQLNSAEVELENEKRAKQRSKQKAQDEAVNEWKAKFEAVQKTYEAAQKNHASEKKEWERANKTHDTEMRELQGENERLEERVSTMKLRLKSTQSDLKDAQAELASCWEELAAAKKATKAVGTKKVTVKEPVRKRRANDMTLDDITIGTPGPTEGASKRATKKRGAERALVGEKSTFSITPFLNRTKNLSDDSIEEGSPTGKMSEAPEPIIEGGEEEEEDASLPPVAEIPTEEVPVQASVKPKKSAAKTQKPRGRPRTKALSDAPTLKKNMPAPPSEKTETIHFGSKLDIVDEEPEGHEQENVPVLKLKKGLELKTKAFEPRAIGANTSIPDADGKKKRRKLLGGAPKTIFDGDEGEAVQVPVMPQLGPKRAKAKLGLGPNAFAGAAFSPLKRDRRGVNASFLA